MGHATAFRAVSIGLVVFLLAWLEGCRLGPEVRRYELKGQIIGVDTTRQELLIKHEAVRGLMDGMTMPFKVQRGVNVSGFAAGDLVTATLEIRGNDASLAEIRKTGTAPIDQPPPASTASSGFELLKPGEEVPDTAFVDQAGRARRFSALRGNAVALTFIYTRCPIPTFCPMLDRQFAALSVSLNRSPIRNRVHLVTITFDPQHDTPAVLAAHARTLEADTAHWSFFTGDRDEIDQFAARFGVSIVRGTSPDDIAHNLRTAIIDAKGKVVKIYTGTEWTPAQLLGDLKKAVEQT
jgi:protein SCO1/2